MIHTTSQKNKGYTLLFAVLVSSLVLAIGISILTISKKEFLLATSARDSSEALYAADGGLECAIYGDVNNVFTAPNGNGTPACNVPITVTAVNNPTGTYSFEAKFGTSGTSCAKVTVTQTVVLGLSHTSIDALGYNTGWDSSSVPNTCSVQSAKRVERRLYYSY